MLKTIKKGFGLGIGFAIGVATLYAVSDMTIKAIVRDTKFVERLKTGDPNLYEKLKNKKYI